MATHRIGFFADIHWSSTDENHSPSRVADDINHLYNTLNCDTVVFGGDQMGEYNDGEGGNRPPGTTESEIRDFWDAVETNGDLSKTYSIPGNHDVPVPFYNRVTAEYLTEDRTETPMKLQPADGLTCLLVSTQGASSVYGGDTGVGIDAQHIPVTELRWLLTEIDEAHGRGDVVVVIGHSPFWFADNSNAGSYHDEAPFSDSSLAYINESEPMSYFVIRNYHQVQQRLASRSPSIVLTGHDKHSIGDGGSYEDYRTVGGVYHTWQDHYAYGSEHRFAYLDVDTSTGNVVYKSVRHSDKSETTIMDVTPSW